MYVYTPPAGSCSAVHGRPGRAPHRDAARRAPCQGGCGQGGRAACTAGSLAADSTAEACPAASSAAPGGGAARAAGGRPAATSESEVCSGLRMPDPDVAAAPIWMLRRALAGPLSRSGGSEALGDALQASSRGGFRDCPSADMRGRQGWRSRPPFRGARRNTVVTPRDWR